VHDAAVGELIGQYEIPGIAAIDVSARVEPAGLLAELEPEGMTALGTERRISVADLAGRSAVGIGVKRGDVRDAAGLTVQHLYQQAPAREDSRRSERIDHEAAPSGPAGARRPDAMMPRLQHGAAAHLPYLSEVAELRSQHPELLVERCLGILAHRSGAAQRLVVQAVVVRLVTHAEFA